MEFSFSIFERIINVYVLVSVTYLSIQFVLAHLHFRKQAAGESGAARLLGEVLAAGRFPGISVIYPIYNESPDVLRKVLKHGRECLAIPNLELIFVDDGSQNLAELRPIYEENQSDRVRVIYKKNGGKRDAQYWGFKEVRGDFIITVDSDTLINIEGIYKLVAPMLRDPRIGAVCGFIDVQNWKLNWLTRLQALRYWLAFNLERAAQSLSGTILCCSGPFSAYRRELIERVKEKYISQRFLGARCTYGDDRHLTNLVLAEGYRTVYQQDAIAFTYVPESLGAYIIQQNRWSKSFYREFFWSLKFWRHLSAYALYDTLLQPFLFVGFIYIFAHKLVVYSISFDWRVILYYTVLLLLMGSVRALYGLARTGNPAFILFMGYGFLHVFVLTPVRLKSILTLIDNGWGSRSSKRQNPLLNFAVWFVVFSFCVITVAICIKAHAPVSYLRSPAVAVPVSTAEYLWLMVKSWNYALFVVPLGTCLLIVASILSDRRKENASQQVKYMSEKSPGNSDSCRSAEVSGEA